MTGMTMTKETDKSGRPSRSEVHRRQRVKNWAILAVLVMFVVLVYFVAIVRMGGG